MRPLLAGETAEQGARDFFRHGAMLRDILQLNRSSRRALRDPPHPSLLRNDTFPRKGGRGPVAAEKCEYRGVKPAGDSEGNDSTLSDPA